MSASNLSLAARLCTKPFFIRKKHERKFSAFRNAKTKAQKILIRHTLGFRAQPWVLGPSLLHLTTTASPHMTSPIASAVASERDCIRLSDSDIRTGRSGSRALAVICQNSETLQSNRFLPVSKLRHMHPAPT